MKRDKRMGRAAAFDIESACWWNECTLESVYRYQLYATGSLGDMQRHTRIDAAAADTLLTSDTD